MLARGRTPLWLGEQVEADAQRWLDERPSQKGFEEESAELQDALGELREAMVEERRRSQKRICLLSVPRRPSKKFRVRSRAESLANAAASMDPRSRTRDPGYFTGEPVDMPSVEVIGVGQVWINEMRTGLARVRDCYALLIGGREITRGSRKYIMRQADWSLMCDPSGALPEIERVTGLKKRRLLHKMRRDKRRQRAARAYLNILRRRKGGLKRPLGVAGVLTNYVTGERKDIWI